MTGSLARYHARSPRYILDTQDDNLIRLSSQNQTSWEEKTEILNISMTGLSFCAPQDLSPKLGEIIKIQFAVPGYSEESQNGKNTMACYAVVIRIQPTSYTENEIAVHFYKLEQLQRNYLLEGLSNKIKLRTSLEADFEDKNKSKKYIISILMAASLITWLLLTQFFWLNR